MLTFNACLPSLAPASPPPMISKGSATVYVRGAGVRSTSAITEGIRHEQEAGTGESESTTVITRSEIPSRPDQPTLVI
jgi:hypothetical protein